MSKNKQRQPAPVAPQPAPQQPAPQEPAVQEPALQEPVAPQATTPQPQPIMPEQKVASLQPQPIATAPPSPNMRIQQLSRDIASLDLTAAQIREGSVTGAKKTPALQHLQAKKQSLQAAIDEAAQRFQHVYQPSMQTQQEINMSQLVRVRAMKTHHPAPTVGDFSFIDVYTNYVEGMKYVVPLYVALSLEETENAMIIG